MASIAETPRENSPSPSSSDTPVSSAPTTPRIQVSRGPLKQIPSTEEEKLALDQQLIDDVLRAVGLLPTENGIDWKPIGTKDGCEMWYAQSEGSKMYQFRGRCKVDCSVKVIEHQFADEQCMRIIDPMCIQVEELRSSKTLGNNRQILRAVFQMPPLISNRDFVWYQLNHTDVVNNRHCGIGKSIEHEAFPEQQGLVRGEITSSGYVIEGIDDTSCIVHYYVQTDPRGWLPAWAVNIVAKQQAYNPGIVKSKAAYFLELESKGLTSGSDPRNQKAV